MGCRIRLRGLEHLRPEQNYVFVSNHTNGLVDPVLVLTTAPCRISPVAKSTLWRIPIRCCYWNI